MSTPRKKRTAKEIFNAAVEYYEPRQWEGYIVDACGDDEALRQRVRELLEAHKQGDSLFIPGGMRHNETATANELEILELSLPADMGTVPTDPPEGMKA